MTYTQIWVIHSVFACQKHSPTADLNRWRILGTGPKARQNCVAQDERRKPLMLVVVGPGCGSSLYATQTSNRSRFCLVSVGDSLRNSSLASPALEDAWDFKSNNRTKHAHSSAKAHHVYPITNTDTDFFFLQELNLSHDVTQWHFQFPFSLWAEELGLSTYCDIISKRKTHVFLLLVLG